MGTWLLHSINRRSHLLCQLALLITWLGFKVIPFVVLSSLMVKLQPDENGFDLHMTGILNCFELHC